MTYDELRDTYFAEFHRGVLSRGLLIAAIAIWQKRGCKR